MNYLHDVILTQIIAVTYFVFSAGDFMRQLYLAIFSLFFLIACNKTDTPEPNIHEPSGVPIKKHNEVNYMQDGTFCFSKLFNQDVTDVQLTILDGAVTGKMDWILYQKDSARGTLRGYENAAHELDLLYDYIIEGNQQTETKIMKIENGKLLIKHGELLDSKNDGNLVYKDISQAKYSEILEEVDCKN